jgi:uncharacterized membrane protein
MSLTDPAALWLLAAVPLVWLAHVVARTNFNRRQRHLQAALRSLLLASLAFALARPIVSTTASRQSLVYAVDVSHSVSGEAIRRAADAIDQLNATVRPDHSRIVAFGRTAATVADTRALRQLAAMEPGVDPAPSLDRRATDIEAGLAAARAELAPGHIPRLVLFSDGRAGEGDTAAAVSHLAANGISVSVQPAAVRTIADTWIESVELPARLGAGASFHVRVAVGSQRDVAGAVELREDGRTIARRAAQFARGTTRVELDAAIDSPGASAIEAVVLTPGDPLAANNSLVRAVWAAPRPKVLYVEGVPASARYLSQALTESGYDVAVRPAAGLPSSVADFDPWDAVVLSDVSRAAIGDASLAALSAWVEERGGGLLVAGGESVFGEGGYRRSPIERLTPVTFERKDEPEVALVLVLDRSWSMAGPSMDLCKAAAQAAVDVLADEQSIGIITFNDSFNWDVPLQNVGKNRENIRRRIAAIGPGGHTLIYPAVEQAYQALRPAKARAKHVVLLSDGRSYPANYEELIRQMVEARITVSSVAVGPAADPELLGNIATWGRGRSYAVSDARELPQIFVKEAKNAAAPAFDEKPITPVVKAPAFLDGVDLTRVPQLKGRTATVLKDTALEVIATDEEDPLLAFWPIGLGRVAVFASDVKDRWAANWVRWRGYAPFFTSVLRAIERRRPPAESLEVVEGPARGQARAFHVSVEARDEGGDYRNLLRPAVQVSGRGGRRQDVTLRQVAPGRYEASVIASASDALTFSLEGGAPAASRRVVPDAAAEYRFRPPDEELLRSIASATGGAWLPDGTGLREAAGDGRTDRRPLAPALIVLALVAWLCDLLLRRIRVLESA